MRNADSKDDGGKFAKSDFTQAGIIEASERTKRGRGSFRGGRGRGGFSNDGAGEPFQ